LNIDNLWDYQIVEIYLVLYDGDYVNNYILLYNTFTNEESIHCHEKYIFQNLNQKSYTFFAHVGKTMVTQYRDLSFYKNFEANHTQIMLYWNKTSEKGIFEYYPEVGKKVGFTINFWIQQSVF